MAETKQSGSGKSRKPAARTSGAKATRDKDTHRSNGAGRSGSRRSGGAGGMSAMDAARSAREHIAELLGRPVEGVLGVDRDHGNWVVTAQVVELERIPNTMDVLGDYEAVLDRDGEVVTCRRTHRYRRGQVDEG